MTDSARADEYLRQTFQSIRSPQAQDLLIQGERVFEKEQEFARSIPTGDRVLMRPEMDLSDQE